MAQSDVNYRKEAEDDAKSMALEFLDQIVTQLEENGKASDDLNNDYAGGDSYHHESNVDRSYSLLEAAKILDDLHEFEETDSGLWEGQMPREAIITQAAYTFGAAVYSIWVRIIEKINEEYESIQGPIGPKEWSPKKKGIGDLSKFVEKVIKDY